MLFPAHHRYSFMLKGAHDFDKTKIKAPFSLIFGNEASGLPDNYAELATSVKIPQSSEIDSFSLPIAASIAMYECKDI
jgi:TrmH family RNA methyltransferase